MIFYKIRFVLKLFVLFFDLAPVPLWILIFGSRNIEIVQLFMNLGLV